MRSRPPRRNGRSSAAPRRRGPRAPRSLALLSFVAGFDERAHVAELLVAVRAELLGLQVKELLEVAAKRLAQQLRRSVVIAVGAARCFGDDLVDDAEALKIGGGHL